MTDFTKDELEVLAIAVDMMVRTEGNAMGQAGANGLKQDRVVLLARRLKLGMSALEKIETQFAVLSEAVPPTEGG